MAILERVRKVRPMINRTRCLDKLGKIGFHFDLVETEQNGTKHYKDEKGNRLILYPDCSYDIEVSEM